ncbi:MAG: response regulator [Gemmatimonadota bacterium]
MQETLADSESTISLAPVRRQPTILIVEDDMDTRTIYSTILQREGYRVLEAENAPEALALVADELPSAILLDIGLPRFGGWGLASIWRDNAVTASIPIAVITAYDSGSDMEWARRLDVERFLSKPVEPLVVVEVVRELAGPGERRGDVDRRSGTDRRTDAIDVSDERRAWKERRGPQNRRID